MTASGPRYLRRRQDAMNFHLESVLQVRYVPSLAVDYPERTPVCLQVCLRSNGRLDSPVPVLLQFRSGHLRHDLAFKNRNTTSQMGSRHAVIFSTSMSTGFKLRAAKAVRGIRWRAFCQWS